MERSLKIIQDYKAGVDVNDIADRYDVTKSTVLRWARAAGLQPRPKGASEAQEATAIAMLQDGEPLKKIAEYVGYSEAWVSHLAKKNGLNRYTSRKVHHR